MDEQINLADGAFSWHVEPIVASATSSIDATKLSPSESSDHQAAIVFSWTSESCRIVTQSVDGLNLRALALSISFAAAPPRVNSYTFRVIDTPVMKQKEKKPRAATIKISKFTAPSESSVELTESSRLAPSPHLATIDAVENRQVTTDDPAPLPADPMYAAESMRIVDDLDRNDAAIAPTAKDDFENLSDVIDDVTSLLELPDSTLDDESLAESDAIEPTVCPIFEEQTKAIEQIAEALEVEVNPATIPAARAIVATESIESDSQSIEAQFAATESENDEQSSQNPAHDSSSPSGSSADATEKPEHTWVKAPADVVKLEDRLFYMLQPSLETLITEGDLHFPFHPFPYQFHGVAFLYPRLAAILADEMGLGKTMQAITSVRLLIHASEVRSVLLVCPKPLVSNWVREFQQWAPEIPVAVIEGDTAKREWQWNQVDAPVKIANYEALIRDRDIATQPDRHFDLIILDESQRIKNRNGTTAQVIRSLNRTRSWALTGTPVENSPDDLFGIFEFVAPGHLRKGMKPKAIGAAAADYILRRTKDKVLTDMPPKMFRDAHVELSPEQNETYQLAENDGILRLSSMGAQATIQHVFELVLRLKQICNFDPATGESSKLERLEADMEEIAASGKKAIIFSQWVGTLEKIKTRLARFGTLEYHGKIPHKQREGVIQQFRNDPDKHVILMSYGAGSVGLNLQFCEYVFLFDRWWNPAIEDQAINRAHRIGAVGPVTVTRFLTMNTIEDRINQVLEEKRELFDMILGGASAHRSLGLSAEEIFGLFKLKTSAGPIKYAA